MTERPLPPASVAAGVRASARAAEYAARLYRPRRARPSEDHPVEGEVRGEIVHPDDRVDPATLGRLAAAETAAIRSLWRPQRDHPVDGAQPAPLEHPDDLSVHHRTQSPLSDRSPE